MDKNQKRYAKEQEFAELVKGMLKRIIISPHPIELYSEINPGSFTNIGMVKSNRQQGVCVYGRELYSHKLPMEFTAEGVLSEFSHLELLAYGFSGIAGASRQELPTGLGAHCAVRYYGIPMFHHDRRLDEETAKSFEGIKYPPSTPWHML